jgi:hypothetical protein
MFIKSLPNCLQAFFHEKDYLNHRYHVKRALFLAGVAKALEANCSAFESFELVPFKGDVRKPILVLIPGEVPIHITIDLVNWLDLWRLEIVASGGMVRNSW